MSTERQPIGTIDRVVDPFRKAAIALRSILATTAGRMIAGMTTVGYLLVYLYAIGHLDRALHPGSLGISVVEDPISMLVRSTGPFQYEPIAWVELYAIDLLVSPLNVGLGLFVGLLVAANTVLSYAAFRAPNACGLDRGGSASAGVFAGIPALLSGTVCCGPAILLVVGLQATAGIMTLFAWLMPAAIVLLFASLAYVGTTVDPTSIDRSGQSTD